MRRVAPIGRANRRRTPPAALKSMFSARLRLLALAGFTGIVAFAEADARRPEGRAIPRPTHRARLVGDPRGPSDLLARRLAAVRDRISAAAGSTW